MPTPKRIGFRRPSGEDQDFEPVAPVLGTAIVGGARATLTEADIPWLRAADPYRPGVTTNPSARFGELPSEGAEQNRALRILGTALPKAVQVRRPAGVAGPSGPSGQTRSVGGGLTRLGGPGQETEPIQQMTPQQGAEAARWIHESVRRGKPGMAKTVLRAAAMGAPINPLIVEAARAGELPLSPEEHAADVERLQTQGHAERLRITTDNDKVGAKNRLTVGGFGIELGYKSDEEARAAKDPVFLEIERRRDIGLKMGGSSVAMLKGIDDLVEQTRKEAVARATVTRKFELDQQAAEAAAQRTEDLATAKEKRTEQITIEKERRAGEGKIYKERVDDTLKKINDLNTRLDAASAKSDTARQAIIEKELEDWKERLKKYQDEYDAWVDKELKGGGNAAAEMGPPIPPTWNPRTQTPTATAPASQPAATIGPAGPQGATQPAKPATIQEAEQRPINRAWIAIRDNRPSSEWAPIVNALSQAEFDQLVAHLKTMLPPEKLRALGLGGKR